MDRIRIETLTRTRSATNPNGTITVASTDTRYCTVVPISPAQAVQRYDCELDGKVLYELRFHGRPTASLKSSRFVNTTNGSPSYLKYYEPKSSPVNLGGKAGYTVLLVEETGEVASA